LSGNTLILKIKKYNCRSFPGSDQVILNLKTESDTNKHDFRNSDSESEKKVALRFLIPVSECAPSGGNSTSPLSVGCQPAAISSQPYLLLDMPGISNPPSMASTFPSLAPARPINPNLTNVSAPQDSIPFPMMRSA
jgi:hypothetical protein